MGLLDKAFGSQSSANAAFNKQEAFLAVLLAAVAADGHISDEEAESLVAVSNRMQILKDMSPTDFHNKTRRILAMFEKHGFEAVLQKASAALPVPLRQAAFANAADLIFADGRIEDEEKQLLEDLWATLQLPEDLALKIVEVLQIKNQG